MNRLPRIALGMLLVGCGATPPTAPDAVPITPPPETEGLPSTARVLRGTFIGAGQYMAEGEVTVTVRDGSMTIDLSTGFRASGVPDPVLYTGSAANPNNGGALRIGRYNALGAQRFTVALPSGPLPSFVILWCDRFNLPIGYAAVT